MFRKLCESQRRRPTEPHAAEYLRASKKPPPPTASASSKKKPRHALHASGDLRSYLLAKTERTAFNA
jgi:hypothetical protein